MSCCWNWIHVQNFLLSSSITKIPSKKWFVPTKVLGLHVNKSKVLKTSQYCFPFIPKLDALVLVNINFYSPRKWNVTETFTYAWKPQGPCNILSRQKTSCPEGFPHRSNYKQCPLAGGHLCISSTFFFIYHSLMGCWCCSAVCPATSRQRRLAGKHSTACVARKKRTFYICSTFFREETKGRENKNLWTLFNVRINAPEVSSLFLPLISQKYSRAGLNSVSGVECFEKWLAVKISSLYKNIRKRLLRTQPLGCNVISILQSDIFCG